MLLLLGVGGVGWVLLDTRIVLSSAELMDSNL